MSTPLSGSKQTQRTVTNLRERVEAARQVFDAAVSFHEAWKPMAYDPGLHQRIGRSYAANTFMIIRFALRREMLLALMRLWGTQDKAIKMPSIAARLGDKRVVDALVGECEAKWLNQSIHHFDPDEAPDPAIDRNILESFAREDVGVLRRSVDEAHATIALYDQGGEQSGVVENLRNLRNKRLAHHKVKWSKADVLKATPTDEDIEKFHQDMSRLIHLLCHAVCDVHYEPAEAAETRRRHAALFWEIMHLTAQTPSL